MATPHERLLEILDEHVEAMQRVRAELLAEIAELAADVVASLERGGKLVTFGNGGSAADAQHFAAELVGRFHRERRALPAIALTTDTSTVTAIANDYRYEDVFARQVEAHVRPADLVVAISTSGNAESVVRGAVAARGQQARTWGLTGAAGGRLESAVDRCLKAPSSVTARVQEVHITVIHAVADLVDAAVAGSGVTGDG